MDINGLIDQLFEDGTIERLLRNPLAQFGPDTRRYIGAEILPERLVNENAYREDAITYKTIVANDGTRYSPVQLKEGARVGSFLVELGENDIGSEFTSRLYDALLRYLATNQTMDAVTSITRWLDTTVVRALVEKIEQQRWQAICDAMVVREGDNGFYEEVLYSNPAGHRVTVPSGTTGTPEGWYDPTYDPMEDIQGIVQLLADKGYQVNRIITSRQLATVLRNHPLIAARLSTFVVTNVGDIEGMPGFSTFARLNGLLGEEGLPAIEMYDLVYGTSEGSARFLPADKMVFVATTGREEVVDMGDEEPLILMDTLGYAGIGRAAGQSTPGRVIDLQSYTKKPPRIEAEGWQTQLPVILEPEAIGVLTVSPPEEGE